MPARSPPCSTAAGIASVAVEVPPGEASKNFHHLEEVVRAILAARLERGDIVIALGGGVVGDLTGFAASIVRRGMRFVQLPTSLLAQVDSSVGGKTGINTAEGKNLVGAFHQPSLVIADTAVLDTLPLARIPRRLCRGGEIRPDRRCALLRLARSQLAGRVLRRAGARACGGDELPRQGASSAADEHETGERALLNLGHTFGHALEAATGLFAAPRAWRGGGDRHGAGASLLGAHEPRLARRCRAGRAPSPRWSGCRPRLADIPGALPDADGLMALIAQDKKVSRGTLTFILTRGVGEAFIARDVHPRPCGISSPRASEAGRCST